MKNIARRIADRGYQSPGRARGAVQRSTLKRKDKDALLAKIDAWEAEGVPSVVVAGRPAEDDPPASKGIGGLGPAPVNGAGGPRIRGLQRLLPKPHVPLEKPITLSLNARVRARLTPYGVSLLYAARAKVAVPDDLLENKAVWETELWQLMQVLGEKLTEGDAPVTVGSTFEVISLGA